MMTNAEIIAVVQAAMSGERIQVASLEHPIERPAEWAECSGHTWNFREYKYRVMPKPREWWLVKTGSCDCGSPGIEGYHAYTIHGCDEADRRNGVHVREVID